MGEPGSKIEFNFDGGAVQAEPGDTVASALYRAGRRIFTRSFKYHRPRGLLCLSGKCPNCLVNVDGQPNVRSCMTPARAGMQVRHQNAYPSLERDFLSAVQHFDWLMPVGWYYKTLTNPKMWHAAEPFIRKVAGLGDPPPTGSEREYEHEYRHTDVAVIGGGPAGLQAALDAARDNQQITLIDDQPELGGHLLYRPGSNASVKDTIAQLEALPNVLILRRSYSFGLYEGNLLGVLQPEPHAKAAERLIHLRTRRVVVATGAYETPVVFPNNDLPGVMLSTAVQRLIYRHGIKPGKQAVVIGTGDRAQDVSTDLRQAGVEVVAILLAESVVKAEGAEALRAIRTADRTIACDLAVICGPRVPDIGLVGQAGGALAWDASSGAFLPSQLPAHVTVVGEAAGVGLGPAVSSIAAFNGGKRSFVCLCSDVSVNDLAAGIAEGFDQIETLKRYTTSTMGPCQGKMCQLASIGVCSRESGRTFGETGTTTARPPNPSVTLGALAGPRHHPVRQTPMHYEHEALGAVWLDMGEWKRPRYYATPTCSEERACVEQEYRAVREAVGLIDVSTLGKLDVKGPDAGKLLDKVYTNRFSDLKPGRVRYSVLCDEAGIMLDDGTISRLSAGQYFITTTTGNLDFVQQWLEWWTVGTGWDVHITNLTPGLAAVNLAGPKARDVLQKLAGQVDLASASFPYMACRQADVAGVPALLLRIGFVGETGWEIHFPAEYGPDLWNALLEAGREFGIRPFAVEAQRLLRLEKRHVIVGVDTDALTSPFEAGMSWVAKLDKDDFIGKAGLLRTENQQPPQKLIGFIMNGPAVPADGAAVVVEGKLAGRVTSARHSPLNGAAVGLAWIVSEHAAAGQEFEIRLDTGSGRARVVDEPFYDPAGARLRM